VAAVIRVVRKEGFIIFQIKQFCRGQSRGVARKETVFGDTLAGKETCAFVGGDASSSKLKQFDREEMFTRELGGHRFGNKQEWVGEMRMTESVPCG